MKHKNLVLVKSNCVVTDEESSLQKAANNQTARQCESSALGELKRGSNAQLKSLRNNVAQFKREFSANVEQSKVMAPLMLKTFDGYRAVNS